MRELQEAVDTLSESKRRVESEVFATLAAEEGDRELQEFYRSIAAALATASGDGIEWPTSERTCKAEVMFFRGRQSKAIDQGQTELAQFFGQVACQLAIREARARRDGRELRRSLAGVRVHWLPPDPNPEIVTIAFPIDTDGLPVF